MREFVDSDICSFRRGSAINIVPDNGRRGGAPRKRDAVSCRLRSMAAESHLRAALRVGLEADLSRRTSGTMGRERYSERKALTGVYGQRKDDSADGISLT